VGKGEKTMIVQLKEHPELKAIVLAAFPSYKKHQAIIHTADSVSLSGTYWDGGSRSTYVAVDLETRRSKGAPQYNPPQFGGPKVVPEVSLPNGIVIVEGGTFCGKTATVTIFIRPDNMTKLLPAV
jgi:hypothetical protein